jgi:hypothetical protein
MDAALYATVWAAVALFVAGEAGKRVWARTGVEPGWAWPLWSAGAALAVAHTLLVFASRYGWEHERALQFTAAQTSAVFGLDWSGGLYVNYLFIAVWIGDAIWWRWRPSRYPLRPPHVTALLRVFYFVVLLNATVVFVAAARRPLGVLLMAILVVMWTRSFAPRSAPEYDRAENGIP